MNTQPIEKPDHGDGSSLDVVSMFDTLQGEGPFAGVPAVFIRLAGCNFQCPICDTLYTDGRKRMALTEIMSKLEHISPFTRRGLVVLTGGEPFRQNIAPLCKYLRASKYETQIETNGTLFVENLPAGLEIVCSPKGGTVHSRLNPTAYKYVLRDGEISDSDGLPTKVLGLDHPPARPPSWFPKDLIFVNPCDDYDPENNKANLQAAVRSSRTYGFRLGIQLHKLAGLE